MILNIIQVPGALRVALAQALQDEIAGKNCLITTNSTSGLVSPQNLQVKVTSFF